MKKALPLLLLVLAAIVNPSYSQNTDSLKKSYQVKGAVTITTKGIAIVPSFSLGQPAAIFDLSLGKKKLFFEPQFRFSLEGKPWSLFFWWRYKLVNTAKTYITLAANPALNFKSVTTTVNGEPVTSLIANRYLAGELSPNYFVAKNISVGLYYLYSHGLDKGTAKHSQFITINSNISNIRLTRQIYARLIPYAYYLRQDGKDGFYATATLNLAARNFPLSVQSIVNKTIESNVPGSQDFLWNASLIYSFNNKYVEP
jgi:hypothetical protein